MAATAKITIRATRVRPADIDPDEFNGDLTDQLSGEGFSDIDLAEADGDIDLVNNLAFAAGSVN